MDSSGGVPRDVADMDRIPEDEKGRTRWMDFNEVPCRGLPAKDFIVDILEKKASMKQRRMWVSIDDCEETATTVCLRYHYAGRSFF